ncbi:rho guanine nucleotide exchange factor; protein t ag [Trichuris trichiura]|uniref:Rho guanine nucleotide exchange factor protein t ag n=1 Tax=Trichuris trichiura TaxID=36087 RepID=A0A077Z0L1_TRITR|nr:rho guanine nucleotide exchange factor; protein t ag [Trichuris trichiura]
MFTTSYLGFRNGSAFQSTACIIRPSEDLESSVAPLRKYGLSRYRNIPLHHTSQKLCQNVSELGKKFNALRIRSFEKHVKGENDVTRRRRSCVSLFDLPRAEADEQKTCSVRTRQRNQLHFTSSVDATLEHTASVPLKRNQTFSEGVVNDLSSIFTCKYGSDRALWSTLKDVTLSGALGFSKLSAAKQRTCEASYRSWKEKICSVQFWKSERAADGTTSFNIFCRPLGLGHCLFRLLNALFLSVKNCIMLDEIFEILADHLAQQESTYVNYCSSLSYQQKTLRNLRKQEFCKAIKCIEKTEELQNQSLSSFLMQPMQRVTRYPLMIDAVLRDLDEKDRRIDSVSLANRMVSKCDQTIKCFERMEELLELENSLTYKSSSPRRFPLVSEKRCFLMKDSFHMLYTLNRPSGRFGWTNCVLFLFSDMLMITKATDHGQFVVKGYCERKFVTVSSAQSCFIPLSKSHNGFFCSLKYVFFCVLEKDHSGKRSEIAFATEEKRQMDQWIDALEKTNDPNGQTYPLAYTKNNFCTVPRRYKKLIEEPSSYTEGQMALYQRYDRKKNRFDLLTASKQVNSTRRERNLHK